MSFKKENISSTHLTLNVITFHHKFFEYELKNSVSKLLKRHKISTEHKL